MSNTEERLTQLETQLAFQDDTLEQLNQQVIKQGQELSLLQGQLKQLNQRFKNLQTAQHEDQQPSLADEKPPHY